MAMEHKVFLFDSRRFNSELRPIIERSLETETTDDLLIFIAINRSILTDPYEGEALSEEHDIGLSSASVDECADYCLTKYYNVKEDLGLGPNWSACQDRVEKIAPGSGGILLGQVIKVGERVFDPGKMGSYFVSADDIAPRLQIIRNMRQDAHGDELLTLLEQAHELAASKGLGLYVTF